MSVALVSAATATATALTVGVEPPSAPVKRLSAENVDLAAAIRLLPNHNQVADVTGGLGTAIYDGNQVLADTIIKAVVNGINLSALAQAAGVDPKSLLTGLLADLPANLLPGILASLSLDVPVLGPVLGQLTGGDLTLLTSVLNLLGIDEVTDGTLTGVLALLGLNLSDPLNLSGLAVPGLNVITAGPTFAALKTLGLDLGWLPSLPNSVASEINGTPYARLGVDGVLDLLLTKLRASNLPLASTLIGPLVDLIASITDPVTSQLPDVIDVRVTPTVGVGLGAFAAAEAYRKVLAQLASQPGGSAYVGTDPLLGSLTILPLVLLNNPGRPDGGALARFGPLASLFGIDTVNPTTAATSSGTGVPVLGTGVKLGAANVLPILVDATYEYQPLSDLASWPNAFTLVNNLAAGLSPTYLLRGLNLDLDGLGQQILGQVGDLVDQSVLSGNPLALNVYLTLHSATLPMLEPLYLASDFLNIVGLNPLAQIPMRIANALAPALRILTDVGYSNVVRNPDGTYTRDFSQAGTETPFLSFPDVNPGLVLSDTINALVGGIQKELGPNPTPNTPNVLANLLNALLSGNPLGGLAGAATPGGGTSGSTTDPLGGLLNGLGGLLGGLFGGLGGPTTPLAASTPVSTLSATSATGIPSASARLLSVAPVAAASPPVGEESKDAVVEKDSTVQKPAADEKTTPVASEETPATDAKTPAASDQTQAAGDATPTTTATGPKHAKPDTAEGSAADHSAPDAGSTKPPKHAKPTTNEVRDTANDFSPKADKPADKPGKTGGDAAGTSTSTSEAGSPSEGSTADKAA